MFTVSTKIRREWYVHEGAMFQEAKLWNVGKVTDMSDMLFMFNNTTLTSLASALKKKQ